MTFNLRACLVLALATASSPAFADPAALDAKTVQQARLFADAAQQDTGANA